MSKKLIAGCVFFFGMALGATAFAGGTGITEEMSRCIYSCKQGGGTQAACWACCVNRICPVVEPIE